MARRSAEPAGRKRGGPASGGRTLADLDKSRTYYMLDTTVCLDIINGAAGGRFGEFFERAGSSGRASFLVPLAIENELGRRLARDGQKRRQMARVKEYLRGYGRCEAKYRYPAERGLRAQTRAVRAQYPELSERDAYLLYVFRRHCRHAELRLLTSDAALRRAASKECPRAAVIDPRRFSDPGKASRN